MKRISLMLMTSNAQCISKMITAHYGPMIYSFYQLEKKSINLNREFELADKLDFNIIKNIYQEATRVQNMLKPEIDFSSAQRVENSFSKSSVKIKYLSLS